MLNTQMIIWREKYSEDVRPCASFVNDVYHNSNWVLLSFCFFFTVYGYRLSQPPYKLYFEGHFFAKTHTEQS